MHTTAKTRQSNFELVRIIAMLMIVASHLACHGVQHVLAAENAYSDYNAASLFNSLFTSFLNPGGPIGVALFFMLTGYFVCRKDSCSVKKVALQSAFYSFALGVFFTALIVINFITRGGVRLS